MNKGVHVFGPSEPRNHVILENRWLDYDEKQVRRAIHNDRHNGRVPLWLRRYVGLVPMFRATLNVPQEDSGEVMELPVTCNLCLVSRQLIDNRVVDACIELHSPRLSELLPEFWQNVTATSNVGVFSKLFYREDHGEGFMVHHGRLAVAELTEVDPQVGWLELGGMMLPEPPM